ncbi:MAG: hypothetical protein FJZ00_00845 [Candidatus Sericytochromatia bacterium]|uniref:Uncharacterized protein n=1 Tax=Candidatus Tanganyikabacteria bacterium TaxID=2961651 RepID=A0A937X0E7_9BACT|nr:hypothetical protein [Candidatus Tanganyikabacteria bacterium]
MLKLKRRCILADEQGQRHEFRVVATLGDGTLLLVHSRYAEEIRLLAAAHAPAAALRTIRDYVVALDPETGKFLTIAELRERLERAANPLLRLVAQSA